MLIIVLGAPGLSSYTVLQHGVLGPCQKGKTDGVSVSAFIFPMIITNPKSEQENKSSSEKSIDTVN